MAMDARFNANSRQPPVPSVAPDARRLRAAAVKAIGDENVSKLEEAGFTFGAEDTPGVSESELELYETEALSALYLLPRAVQAERVLKLVGEVRRLHDRINELKGE